MANLSVSEKTVEWAEFQATISQDKTVAKIEKGQHCLAYMRPERDLGARSKYSVEIHFDIIGSPYAPTEREKIAFWLSANFPKIPDNLTILTLDQTEFILDYKDWIIRIAKIFSGKWDNPLNEELRQGIINQLEHDLIWNQAKLYFNLWELILVKWKPLKTALASYWDCSFESPAELFEQIVVNDFQGEFERCLKSRYEVNPKVINRLATIAKKAQKKGFLTKEETTYWEKHHKLHISENIWWSRLELILAEVCERRVDPTVEAHVKINNALVDAICQLYQKAACDPIWGFQSVTWIDGNRHLGVWHKSANGKLRPARRNKS